jgi:hypothetical protein
MLRPLAGESVFETLERAGNYGVPLAFALLTAMPRPWRGLLAPLGAPSDAARDHARAATVLRWTTALLLVGHGGLGVIGKPMLTAHYAAIALPAATTVIVGWSEIALAVLVLARPSVTVLVFVATWKLASESLFVVSGAPVWEFVERAGSYAAPLALAALLARPNFVRWPSASSSPAAPSTRSTTS